MLAKNSFTFNHKLHEESLRPNRGFFNIQSIPSFHTSLGSSRNTSRSKHLSWRNAALISVLLRTNLGITAIEKKHLHGFSMFGRRVWLRIPLFLNPLATGLPIYSHLSICLILLCYTQSWTNSLLSIIYSSNITYFSKFSISLSFASSISTLLCFYQDFNLVYIDITKTLQILILMLECRNSILLYFSLFNIHYSSRSPHHCSLLKKTWQFCWYKNIEQSCYTHHVPECSFVWEIRYQGAPHPPWSLLEDQQTSQQ